MSPKELEELTDRIVNDEEPDEMESEDILNAWENNVQA